jgi:hypothetical protein
MRIAMVTSEVRHVSVSFEASVVMMPVMRRRLRWEGQDKDDRG